MLHFVLLFHVTYHLGGTQEAPNLARSYWTSINTLLRVQISLQRQQVTKQS